MRVIAIVNLHFEWTTGTSQRRISEVPGYRWRAFARLCENEEKFYEEVDFRGDQKLEWDKIQNEDEYDFSIEED